MELPPVPVGVTCRVSAMHHSTPLNRDGTALLANPLTTTQKMRADDMLAATVSVISRRRT